MINTEKETKERICNYGIAYQLRQADSYRNRNTNHWKLRIAMAKKLVSDYVCPRLKDRPNKEIVLLDVGCSIGTFAIEFAKEGFRCFGLDYDNSAMEVGKQLAREEKVNVDFYCSDALKLNTTFPPLDIVICFDIFEHLHSGELELLLSGLKNKLSQNGCIVFHTFPTQYEHIFYTKRFLSYPFMPFVFLPEKIFSKLLKVYAYIIDLFLILTIGQTNAERMSHLSHCNLLSRECLSRIFLKAGYEIIYMSSSNLYPGNTWQESIFKNQPSSHRNIYGVATLKSTD